MGNETLSASKVFSRKLKQLLRKFFGNGGRKRVGRHKLKLPSLFRHGVSNFANAMPNEVHRRRSREIQIALAIAIPNINAGAPHSHGIRLMKRPSQHWSAKLLLEQHRFGHTRIIATRVVWRGRPARAELRSHFARA